MKYLQEIQLKHQWKQMLLGLGFLILGTRLAFAAPDMSVTSISGAPGSTVSVSVIADFSQAVNSMQFNLQFDSNLLTVSNVTAGSADSSWVLVKNTNTPGTVTVGMFNTGGDATALNGSAQQIAVIQFSVNNPPRDASTSSILTMSNAIFDSTTITQLAAGAFTLNVPPVTYTLTVNTSGGGTVNQNPSSASYNSGTQVVLTAGPSSGYQFSSWTGDATGSTNPLTITMNANKNITASFSASAVAPTPVKGVCGTAATTYPYGTTGYGTNTFCAAGKPYPAGIFFPTAGGTVRWTCEGLYGGLNTSCSAKQASPAKVRHKL